MARAINLTRADLPGYTAKTHSETASDRASGARLARCLGATPPSADLLDQPSPDFDTGAGLSQQEISSDVSILPSSQQVENDLAAITGSKAAPCFKAFINRELQRQGGGQVSFDPVQVVLDRPAVGAAGESFEYRFTDIAHAGSQRIPFYIDVIGWAFGQAEIELDASSISQPPPSNLLNRLESLLVDRAVHAT